VGVERRLEKRSENGKTETVVLESAHEKAELVVLYFMEDLVALKIVQMHVIT